MKKIITVALMVATLASGVQGNEIETAAVLENNSTASTVETESTVVLEPVEVVAPAPEGKGGITAKDVVGAVVAPVYVAGMVATAIVVAPFWLAKKVFGK